MIPQEWYGCFRHSWQNLLVPQAFQHPGKYNRGVLDRLYDALQAAGYLRPGYHIHDPFGGVGTAARRALAAGYHWQGVEIEVHHVEAAQANFRLWQEPWMPGTATMLHGDSRQDNGLEPESVDVVMGSPPYDDLLNSSGEGPSARFDSKHHRPGNSRKLSSAPDYGATPGNLALASTRPSRLGELPDFDRDALLILGQCRRLLKPAGIAVWVTKDYVRGGRRIAFSDRWEALCDRAGFVCVQRVWAMLVDPPAFQLAIDGSAAPAHKQYKSQWRRDAEAKGAPAIDYEDVRFFVKRSGN